MRLRLLHPNDTALGMLVVESPSEKEGVQRPLPTHLLEVLGALAPALQASAKEIFLMRIGERPKVHVRAEVLRQAEGQAAGGEAAEGEAAREGSAEWHARLLLPRKLQSKLRSQLAGIDRRNMYSELKSYRVEPSAEARQGKGEVEGRSRGGRGKNGGGGQGGGLRGGSADLTGLPKSARLVLTGGVCPLALQARKVMVAVMVLVGHGRWAGSDKVLTTWDDVQAQERRWTSPLTHPFGPLTFAAILALSPSPSPSLSL